MLEVIRRHGLVAFIFALAVVTLVKAAAEFAAGRLAGSAGAALLLVGVAAGEIERRKMTRAAPYLNAVRWAGVLGALGFLLWRT